MHVLLVIGQRADHRNGFHIFASGKMSRSFFSSTIERAAISRAAATIVATHNDRPLARFVGVGLVEQAEPKLDRAGCVARLRRSSAWRACPLEQVARRVYCRDG